MKWFVPITAVTCALVVALVLMVPSRSSPARGEGKASRVCLDEPDWFAAIHRSYDCNPRITPDFDFASLYSGVLRPETVASLQALQLEVARAEAGGKE